MSHAVVLFILYWSKGRNILSVIQLFCIFISPFYMHDFPEDELDAIGHQPKTKQEEYCGATAFGSN